MNVLWWGDRLGKGNLATLNHDLIRELLDKGGFGELFRARLGWDNPPDHLGHGVPMPKEDGVFGIRVASLTARAVAEKRGVLLWVIDCSEIPPAAKRNRTVRDLKKYSADQLVVFATADEQLWLWPEQRPSGTGFRLVDHHYRRGRGNDALLQRLERVRFEIKESKHLTGPKVLERVRQSFNVEKVTKDFYKKFQEHHQALTDRIEGIPLGKERERRWYASVLLSRLKFIYFIQRKGFLNSDSHYLRTSLGKVREHFGPDKFYSYFREFLLPLFHVGLGSPSQERAWSNPVIEKIVGQVPYVDGGIFERHDLERDYEIDIPDRAFEEIFDFFDQWRWHLDERPSGDHKEINPDILGFIFEQYVNYTEKGRKEKGAYYTKPDVTGYMSTYTIIPAVVDRLVAAGLEDPTVLLPNSKDRYLHDSLGYGIAKGLPDGELPPSDYPDPELDIALPGERWCDVTHRRGRYRELVELVDGGGVKNIDDAITANLDIVGLMEDYLSVASADECVVALDALRSLTVCDPTCGSGAFLLAALDVLEPLYTAVCDRVEELVAAGGSDGPLNELKATIGEADSHPNRRYWLLKTICLNNLYGMDLMGEAAEIAKLRLFLKLVAQLEDVSQIEPLPDLDFNIKTGNLLVGIADPSDVARRFGDVLQSLPGLAAAEHAAQVAADAYDEFASAQLSSTSVKGVSGKRRLVNQIQAAAAQADNALYDIRAESKSFEEWKNSHVPFHWFAEFPSVWRNGGFDVVIGNPPYINKKQVTEYTWRGYATEKCPDLYAVCMERASTLLNDNGRMGMIVPHSISFSKDYPKLRDYTRRTFPAIWASSYSRQPSGLFSGSAAVRNTIIVAAVNPYRSFLATTELRRWERDFRPFLFATHLYLESDRLQTHSDQWLFAGPGPVVEAFAHMLSKGRRLGNSVTSRSADHQMGYKTTALYTLSPWLDEPPAFDKSGFPTGQPQCRWVGFHATAARDIAYLVLAGRWGFLWWALCGDDFHVVARMVDAFPADLQRVAESPQGPELTKLAQKLRQESPRHRFWIRKAGRKIGNYDLRKLRHITDEADRLLAEVWDISEAFEAAGEARERRIWPGRATAGI